MDRVGISGGIVLLVFLLEPAWILAGVTRAAAVRRGRALRVRDGDEVAGHSLLQALVSGIAKTRCLNARLAASKGSENLIRRPVLEQATRKPYTRHILGIDSGLQSHLKAIW